MGMLAITGGEKAKTKAFPPYPVIREKDKNALIKAFESGRWAKTHDRKGSGQKDDGYISKLEQSMAAFHQQTYALAVANCTVALELAIEALGIGCGDEVIVTSYSFVASATCILKAKAIPVFADIDEHTWNISSESIRSCITQKTKAIVVVHFAGQAADMDSISGIAKEYGLKIISDGAHALASKWNGLPIARYSDITCFSFQHSKNITCGEGGLIVTNDGEVYQRLYSLHMIGRDFNQSWYVHNRLGSNYRITEFQAAIAYSQFEDHPEFEQIRNQNGWFLTDCLSGIDGLESTRTIEKARDRSFHLLAFAYKEKEWGNLSKRRFILALNAEGIPCHGGYEIPIYQNPLFDHYPEVKNRHFDRMNHNAEAAAKQAIWLHQNLLLGDRQDMEEIVAAVTKIRNNFNELIRKKPGR